MRSLLFSILLILPFILILSRACSAQDFSSTVIFQEASFPSADTDSAAAIPWQTALSRANVSSSAQLRDHLQNPSTKLLVFPYGSAFPEDSWSDIHSFLSRGGNLLVLGGRPFTRSAYFENGQWHLRDYSVRFIRQLSIDQYQPVAGSDGLAFESNPDIPLQLAAFSWKRAFSPVIRLSQVDLYPRGGAAGSIDARLDPLAWTSKENRRLAAPVLQIDRFQNGFDGGRWIFLTADLPANFLASQLGIDLIRKLAAQALRGSEQFTVRPMLPLYVPGETVELQVESQFASAPATRHSRFASLLFPKRNLQNLSLPPSRFRQLCLCPFLLRKRKASTLLKPNSWKAALFERSIAQAFGFAISNICGLVLIFP